MFRAIQDFCGLQMLEICRLDCRFVELAEGLIRIDVNVAEGILIPFSDYLREWLLPIAQKVGPINPSTDDRGL